FISFFLYTPPPPPPLYPPSLHSALPISLHVYDFEADRALAEQYGIDKIPATILMLGGDQPQDYGIRYYGIPSGYEFSSLVQSILDRKSTRLNSSHVKISYAVFCLKKKKK